MALSSPPSSSPVCTCIEPALLKSSIEDNPQIGRNLGDKATSFGWKTRIGMKGWFSDRSIPSGSLRSRGEEIGFSFPARVASCLLRARHVPSMLLLLLLRKINAQSFSLHLFSRPFVRVVRGKSDFDRLSFVPSLVRECFDTTKIVNDLNPSFWQRYLGIGKGY